jgi:RNA polymerase sigma-70 factor, ECF subfamily
MSSPPDLVLTQITELLPKMRRFARSLTRNIDDADDLVQLALERALTHVEQWQPGSRLDSWLYRIVKNAWIDELRGRRRGEQLLSGEQGVEQVVDPGGDASDGLAVSQALSRLPPEQRLAVSLVLIEGLPYKDAAQIIGVPMGTLTSRLARARDALQALLEPGAQA